MKRQKRTKSKSTRDQYLRRKFNITEEEFNQQFEAQGSVCKICSRPPGTRSLHVDHDHGIERWKIDVEKVSNGSYRAWPRGYYPYTAIHTGESKLFFAETGTSRMEAKAKVKKRLMRYSVRGIVCWPCNKGLKVFSDNPLALTNAGTYLSLYYDHLNRNTDHPNFRGLA